MTERADEMHEKVTAARSRAFAQLMDHVYGSMSPSARNALPCEYPKQIGEYVNAIVSYALCRLDEFETELKRAVVGNFEENSRGERFILDPLRTSRRAEHCLFVDVDGELVTVRGPRLERSLDSGSLVLKTYTSYEVLTGPQAGTTFGRNERRLPAHPELRGRLGAASAAPTADALEGRFTDVLSRVSKGVENPDVAAEARLFLSYSSRDRSLARRIQRRLSSRGLSTWLDEEQVHPGDVLPASLQTAIRLSTHFLLLVTESAVASKWVARELDFARAVDGLRIIPLIGSSAAASAVLDEMVGVPVFDTTQLEEALDGLCRRITPEAAAETRNEVAMRQGLAALRAEHPLLSSLDLTTYTARAQLETISLANVDVHSMETFVALAYDLAVLTKSPDDTIASLVCNVAAVFGALGAGAYVLKHFIDRCEDPITIHRVFTPFTSERLSHPKLIPTVQRLFEACRPPHHVVLKWFVDKNLDRLSEAQRRWAISHFVTRATDPTHDALITAFVFLELMPYESSLLDLLDRWIGAGKLGFERGVVHEDEVAIYFRLMNKAIADRHDQFESSMTNFRNHLRSIARGRTFPELLAAATIVWRAGREQYTRFQELLGELSDAPYTAEWKRLELAPATTRAFTAFAAAMERGEDESEALERLQQAPRDAQLIAYCSDVSEAARLSSRLSDELKRDLVTEAGSAVVVRGPSAHSEELASRLLAEGYSVVMLKAV